MGKDNLDIDSQEQQQPTAVDDSFEYEPAPAELDAIRKRTFNPELKNLLTKITSHELTSDELTDEDLTEGNAVDEESLMQRFHELFYKTTNLLDLEDGIPSYNPYSLINKTRDYLCKDIRRQMNNVSMDDFAILSFDFDMGCYIPSMFNIPEMEKDSLVLDINGDIFQKIVNSNNGLVLDSKTINDNLFLKKTLDFSGIESGNKFLYFLSFKKVYYNFINELKINDLASNESSHLHSILMVLLDEKNVQKNDKVLFRKIKSVLHLQSHFYDRGSLNEIMNDEKKGLNRVLLLLDFFYSHSSKEMNKSVIIIKAIGNVEARSLLLLNYLYTKISAVLSGNTVVSFLNKDCIVIFTDNSGYSTISTLFKGIEDLFKVVKLELNDESIKNFRDILREYIF